MQRLLKDQAYSSASCSTENREGGWKHYSQAVTAKKKQLQTTAL